MANKIVIYLVKQKRKVLATFCTKQDAEWYIAENNLDAVVYPVLAFK